jgi:hypothetical protein
MNSGYEPFGDGGIELLTSANKKPTRGGCNVDNVDARTPLERLVGLKTGRDVRLLVGRY